MEEIKNGSKASDLQKEKNISRKKFFRYVSASVVSATAAGLYGCDNGIFSGDDDEDDEDVVDLGSGDTGILNYAYALEQLEAAFYTEVMNNPYSEMTDEENQILEDLRRHEVAHRDFYAAALGQDAIPELEVNFSDIDFNSRSSVLETARTFEDLGVSAYNGAGQLLENTDFLLQAGKIVSVEARHAAAIRDLLDPNTTNFAGDDIVNPDNGLDVVRSTDEVLSAASDFIETEIDASNLPEPQN